MIISRLVCLYSTQANMNESRGWANMTSMGVKGFIGGSLCVSWHKPAVTNFIFSVWFGSGHPETVCACFIWPATTPAPLGMSGLLAWTRSSLLKTRQLAGGNLCFALSQSSYYRLEQNVPRSGLQIRGKKKLASQGLQGESGNKHA